MLIGHKKQWEFLKEKFELDQLSHAYLFTGACEIGKKTFATELSKLINCKGEKPPCQKCASCQAIGNNSFPDLMIVSAKDGGEIQISQIKQVQNFLSYKSYYGSFKIVVVDDAEKMNQEAQSCFLKTLEEPRGRTLIILVSSKPDMLLPTIASRCQTLKFFRPKDLPINSERLERSREILKNLMPVINSGLADKFKYVKALDLEQQDVRDILEVCQKYLRRSLYIETGMGEPRDAVNLFNGAPYIKKYPVQKIKNIINLVEDLNNKLIFTNANPKLALEILLMEL